MNEFVIKSADSDLKLVLSDIKDDYFKVNLISDHLTVFREVWAYTDAYGFADLLENIASMQKPWEDEVSWETIEGDLKIKITCNILGKVKFQIELSSTGEDEDWSVKTYLNTELGQLEHLAKSARKFFGSSPE